MIFGNGNNRGLHSNCHDLIRMPKLSERRKERERERGKNKAREKERKGERDEGVNNRLRKNDENIQT